MVDRGRSLCDPPPVEAPGSRYSLVALTPIRGPFSTRFRGAKPLAEALRTVRAVPDWAISLVSVAVGGVLAYIGSLHLQRLRGREEAQRERRQALSTFFARLVIVVGVVRQWPATPEPNPLERLRESIVGRSDRLKVRDWVRTQRRMRKVFWRGLL